MIVAVFVLLLRWVLLAVVRRLTAFSQYAPDRGTDQRAGRRHPGDVLRELRRVGLPGHMWTLPLLVVRLIRSARRADTVERLRAFELARVVPKPPLDEMFLLLRQAGTGGCRRRGA